MRSVPYRSMFLLLMAAGLGCGDERLNPIGPAPDLGVDGRRGSFDGSRTDEQTDRTVAPDKTTHPDLSKDDPCALSKDVILKSELSNYNCEGIPGCQWKELGGKIEMHYACCPVGFKPSDYSTESPIYKRCALIID